MSTRDYGYIIDIWQCAQIVCGYIKDVSHDEFLVKKLYQDAVIRNLEIIGEAAGSLSKEFRVEHPHINWRSIVNMRNELIHVYRRVNIETVWIAATVDIPALQIELKKIPGIILEEPPA